MPKSNRAACSLRRRAAELVLGATGVAALAGCGNGMAQVSGAVTMGGEPIAGGGDTRCTVNFIPEGGAGAQGVGLVDANGRYTIQTGSLSGVKPGGYIVTILATTLVPSTVEGFPPGGRVITPRRYADPGQSGFRVEVEPGANEFQFDLEPPRGRGR